MPPSLYRDRLCLLKPPPPLPLLLVQCNESVAAPPPSSSIILAGGFEKTLRLKGKESVVGTGVAVSARGALSLFREGGNSGGTGEISRFA